jgi:hypothetical protein
LPDTGCPFSKQRNGNLTRKLFAHPDAEWFMQSMQVLSSMTGSETLLLNGRFPALALAKPIKNHQESSLASRSAYCLP